MPSNPWPTSSYRSARSRAQRQYRSTDTALLGKSVARPHRSQSTSVVSVLHLFSTAQHVEVAPDGAETIGLRIVGVEVATGPHNGLAVRFVRAGHSPLECCGGLGRCADGHDVPVRVGEDVQK